MSSSLSDANYPEDVRRASIEVDELLHLLKHLVRSQLELTEYLSSPEGRDDSDIISEAVRDNEASIINMNARIDQLLLVLPQSDPRKQLLNRSRAGAPVNTSDANDTGLTASTSGASSSEETCLPVPSAAEALAEEAQCSASGGEDSIVAAGSCHDNSGTAGAEVDDRGGMYL
jgi:hypothetical protein